MNVISLPNTFVTPRTAEVAAAAQIGGIEANADTIDHMFGVVRHIRSDTRIPTATADTNFIIRWGGDEEEDIRFSSSPATQTYQAADRLWQPRHYTKTDLQASGRQVLELTIPRWWTNWGNRLSDALLDEANFPSLERHPASDPDEFARLLEKGIIRLVGTTVLRNPFRTYLGRPVD